MDDLALEFTRFARYLIGAEPSEALVVRNREATAVLFPDAPSPGDRSILEFVRRHPWSLPCLDAATAIFRPRALLRKKVLLALALLEATPEHAKQFEADTPGPLAAFVRLGWHGAVAAVRVVSGAVLLSLFVRPAR